MWLVSNVNVFVSSILTRTVLDSAPPTMAGTVLAKLPHPPATGTMLDLVFEKSA